MLSSRKIVGDGNNDGFFGVVKFKERHVGGLHLVRVADNSAAFGFSDDGPVKKGAGAGPNPFGLQVCLYFPERFDTAAGIGRGAHDVESDAIVDVATRSSMTSEPEVSMVCPASV